jgi:predicted molibdopterin-dependent oxidoreductase YjgC
MPWFTDARMFRHVGGGSEVRFLLDGVEHTAIAGQSVAAALLGLGEGVFRHAPDSGAPRGPYCLMGVCFECLIEIDGVRRQSCLATIEPGMRVVRRLG